MVTDLLNTLKANRYNIPDKIEIYEMVVAEAERSTKDWSEEELKKLGVMVSSTSDAYVTANTILTESAGMIYYFPVGEDKWEDVLYTESISHGGNILQLSPNPIAEVSYISNRSLENCYLKIYEVNGKLMNEYFIKGLGIAEFINVSYGSGYYLIKYNTTVGKELNTYKFIKVK